MKSNAKVVLNEVSIRDLADLLAGGFASGLRKMDVYDPRKQLAEGKGMPMEEAGRAIATVKAAFLIYFEKIIEKVGAESILAEDRLAELHNRAVDETISERAPSLRQEDFAGLLEEVIKPSFHRIAEAQQTIGARSLSTSEQKH